jgi:hypothetical protein
LVAVAHSVGEASPGAAAEGEAAAAGSAPHPPQPSVDV